MSRDVQILYWGMTPQPSLRYSEFPLASICQCLPPASQPYCHHSEESGSRPQAEAQSKLSTFPPVQSSQQSGLSVLCSLLPTTVLSQTQSLACPPAVPPLTNDCSLSPALLLPMANQITALLLIKSFRVFDCLHMNLSWDLWGL